MLPALYRHLHTHLTRFFLPLELQIMLQVSSLAALKGFGMVEPSQATHLQS
jgi:hypothetical protein